MSNGWMDRRRFLCGTVKGVASVSLLSAVSLGRAVGAREAPIEIVELANDVFQLRGADANVVVRRTPDAIVVVNGGPAEQADAMLGVVSRLAGRRPVGVLFNTCWQPGCTGLNPALGRAGTRIIAHQNTRGWLSLDFHSPWAGRDFAALPEEALPNDTFRTNGGRLTVCGALELQGERIEYGHMPQAHTDGDLYLHFQDSNVLVVGEVLSVGRYPLIDYYTGGYIAGLTQATSDLMSIADADSIIVPGDGPAQGRAAVERQYRMLSTVFPRIARWKDDGMSAADMVANGVTAEFDSEWGMPQRFVDSAYWSIWGHMREYETVV